VTVSLKQDPRISTLGPDETLDTVGLYCPLPIIKTAERMKRMTEGATLKVLSDDRVILVDMPAWCRSTGHEYLGWFQDGLEFHLYVRKRSSREAR
jgi:TusA-related sulfurtransferase